MNETILYLLERITRAKAKLEAMKTEHSASCMIDMDPDYYGPCTCGSTKNNGRISDILAELEIKPDKIRMG